MARGGADFRIRPEAVARRHDSWGAQHRLCLEKSSCILIGKTGPHWLIEASVWSFLVVAAACVRLGPANSGPSR